jgi:lipoprotein-releasing system permease protein
LNLPFFISRRITRQAEGTFSQSINKVAIISIAVGISSLLLSFIILGGFQDKIREKIFSFSGQLLITQYSLSSSFEDNSIVLDDTVKDVLAGEEYIRRWQSYAYKAGLLKTDEEVQGVIIKGIDDTFDTAYFASNIKSGKLPTSNQKGYSTEVALSSKIASYLGLEVGDEVLVFFVQNPPRYRNLQVTGIYETGLEEFDEKIVLGDINLVRRINGWSKDEIGGIEVFLNDDIDSYEAQTKLFNALPSDLYVKNVIDQYLQIFDWLSLLNRNVVILLVLILFVACFSMISIVLILIMERTQLIGMLKAMGSTNQLIRRIFVVLGVRLIIRGLFWGNLLGLGLAALQHYFQLIPLDPVNYYMSYVPVKFDWFIIIMLNLITTVIIGLTLWIPVLIISRIQPIRSIRFD